MFWMVKPVQILCVADVTWTVPRSLLSNINHVCVIHSLQMMLISSSFTCANKMTTNNSSSMALKAVLVSDVGSIKTCFLPQNITMSIRIVFPKIEEVTYLSNAINIGKG